MNANTNANANVNAANESILVAIGANMNANANRDNQWLWHLITNQVQNRYPPICIHIPHTACGESKLYIDNCYRYLPSVRGQISTLPKLYLGIVWVKPKCTLKYKIA